MNQFTNKFWNELDPNRKRWIVIALAVFVVFGVAAVFMGEEESKSTMNRKDTIKHVLTDKNTREIGIDSLSADVKLVTRENSDLRREVERLRTDLDQTRSKQGTNQDVGRDIEYLKVRLERLTQQNRELQHKLSKVPDQIQNATKTAHSNDLGATGSSDTDTVVSEVTIDELPFDDPQKFFQYAPVPDKPPVANQDWDDENAAVPRLTIQSVTQPSPTNVEEQTETEEPVYLPAGSIITGVLLNGMDAPTSNAARQDPFPATIRIQKDAILPNHFHADVRECFVLVSGYGDLSSERAYLRGETISCVREDGGVIESRFDSYLVGEDGKAGIRGRLVSKQGQLIARSLMAGFLGGVAEAFDVNPVPVINTQPGSDTIYQSVLSDGVYQGAAVKGASKALDRIAQFYIDMAEGIFPVIEIDAGRRVEIIMTTGASLNLKSSGAF